MSAYMNTLLNAQKSQQAADLAQIQKLKAAIAELDGICYEREKVIKLMEAAAATNHTLTLRDILGR